MEAAGPEVVPLVLVGTVRVSRHTYKHNIHTEKLSLKASEIRGRAQSGDRDWVLIPIATIIWNKVIIHGGEMKQRVY